MLNHERRIGMYYVTKYNSRTVRIHDSKYGAVKNTYCVNHDIENIEVNGDEFFVIGPRITTIFRRNGGAGNFSFIRVGTRMN